MDPVTLEGRQAPAQHPQSRSPKEALTAIRHSGLAVLAVAVAVGLALLFQQFQFRDVEVPLFLFGLAIAAWFGGLGAALLAWVLSCLSFDYFFVPPIHTLAVEPSEIPYFAIFAVFASLVTWFSTVRRRVERDLRQARDDLQKRSVQLEASNKELEAFAYSVSHDLRAPLRHMAGFSELLQKNSAQVFDDKSKRYVGVILESAKKMGALIDDLLAFSRIGRAETNKTTINLGQLVEEALAEVRRDVGDRKIVWKVGKIPTGYGDRAMVRLALVNLISNAVKFTRTRTPAEIEIGQMPATDDQVVIFVRDNGVGFDMKYVGKLFGVFQRLHSTEAFEGTGIGLATVQRIAHRHGGRAWGEGSLNQGATFYLSISKSQQN
ncbi:MAG: ATP-binding protein [Chthoniobacterales bacterium]